MKPLEIACRHTDPDGTNCGAEAGDPCVRTSGYGSRYAAQIPHAERVADAEAMSAPSSVDPERLDEAIEAVVDQIL